MTGWYLLRFLDELAGGVSALQIGDRALMAVRDGDQVRVFDATCPHRGASLAHGGTLDGDCVVCPFHAKRVRLGGPGRWSVAEHAVLQAGAAVFVRIGDEQQDRGFAAALGQVADGYDVVAATRRVSRVPAAYVAENAFDTDHFPAVHRVPRASEMTVRCGPAGELRIDGEFRTATSPWGSVEERESARRRGARAGGVDYAVASTFSAAAYSPHLVLTCLGTGRDTGVVITGGLPTAEGGCEVRVAVGASDERAVPALVAGARKAIAEDCVVWDHLDVNAAGRYDARDTGVLAFRSFCAGFAS